MVVRFGLDVDVGEEEDGEDDHQDVPAREDQPIHALSALSTQSIAEPEKTHGKVSLIRPIFSGAYHALNATIAGICNRQTYNTPHKHPITRTSSDLKRT